MNEIVQNSDELSWDSIESIIQYNLEIYLQEHLTRLPWHQHSPARTAFEGDIQRIAQFCRKISLIPFSEESLKKIHTVLYPSGYIQKSKDAQGNEFVWMIPGEYRNIVLTSKEQWGDPYSKPRDISHSVREIIEDYNTSVDQSSKNVKDAIAQLVIQLVKIHPFGDGNGRLAGIISDLLLYSHGLPKMGLLRSYKLHKESFVKILIELEGWRNFEKLYSFARENQN